MAKAGRFMKVVWGSSSTEMTIAAFKKQIVSSLPTVEQIAERMEEALDVVEETAMELVPVKTGATKRSFFRRVEIVNGKVVGTAGFNEDGSLSYVGLIHEGFVPLKSAEPFFLSNAFTRNRYKINEILEKV